MLYKCGLYRCYMLVRWSFSQHQKEAGIIWRNIVVKVANPLPWTGKHLMDNYEKTFFFSQIKKISLSISLSSTNLCIIYLPLLLTVNFMNNDRESWEERFITSTWNLQGRHFSRDFICFRETRYFKEVQFSPWCLFWERGFTWLSDAIAAFLWLFKWQQFSYMQKEESGLAKWCLGPCVVFVPLAG